MNTSTTTDAGVSTRPDIRVKVPRFYRYFRIGKRGYIVMEFIDGISLDKIPFEKIRDDGLIEPLARAVCHLFAKIRPRSLPVESTDDAEGSAGPANGGVPRGYLFSEDGALEPINSVTSLNRWINQRYRLKNGETGFSFSISDCGFCHLDLARRNFVLLPDGCSFALLDWEHAGFYPRVFEVYCILFVGIHDFYFCEEFVKGYKKYTTPEIKDGDDLERMIDMLDRVYKNNLRYT